MTLKCWLQQARVENKKAANGDNEPEVIDEEDFEYLGKAMMNDN